MDPISSKSFGWKCERREGYMTRKSSANICCLSTQNASLASIIPPKPRTQKTSLSIFMMISVQSAVVLLALSQFGIAAPTAQPKDVSKRQQDDGYVGACTGSNCDECPWSLSTGSVSTPIRLAVRKAELTLLPRDIRNVGSTRRTIWPMTGILSKTTARWKSSLISVSNSHCTKGQTGSHL